MCSSLCKDLDLLALESNHAQHMLRTGPYPIWLKRRIESDTGHLSNRAAADVVTELMAPQLAHVVLAHLSETNNTPEIARRNMSRALRKTSFKGKLTIAKQDDVVGPIMPRDCSDAPFRSRCAA